MRLVFVRQKNNRRLLFCLVRYFQVRTRFLVANAIIYSYPLETARGYMKLNRLIPRLARKMAGRAIRPSKTERVVPSHLS